LRRPLSASCVRVPQLDLLFLPNVSWLAMVTAHVS
jgi:hypothetical protein